LDADKAVFGWVIVTVSVEVQPLTSVIMAEYVPDVRPVAIYVV